MYCIKCKRDIPDDSLYCNYCGKKQTVEKKKKLKRANHDGGAYKRGSTYTAIWTSEKCDVADDGRLIQHRKTKGGFRTRREAEEYARMMSDAKTRPKTAPTLKHYWEIYQSKRLPELSRTNISAHKLAWERMKDLHGLSVDAIYTADMQNVVDNNCDDSYYSAKYMKIVLCKLYEYAAAEGFVNRDMPHMIKLPKHEQKTERVPFTKEEQNALWKSYCDGNTEASIPLTMIYTGMMPGEIQILKLKHIDFDSGTVIGIGMKTKTRKQTAVVLNEEASALLRERCSSITDPESLVFPYANGVRFYEAYYNALEKAGVRKLSPYSCRHTTATILAVKENIPPEAVKLVMRWSSVKMLDTYAHPDLSDAKEAVRNIRISDSRVNNRVDNQ